MVKQFEYATVSIMSDYKSFVCVQIARDSRMGPEPRSYATGLSRCHPDDTFDFYTGQMIAASRAELAFAEQLLQQVQQELDSVLAKVNRKAS